MTLPMNWVAIPLYRLSALPLTHLDRTRLEMLAEESGTPGTLTFGLIFHEMFYAEERIERQCISLFTLFRLGRFLKLAEPRALDTYGETWEMDRPVWNMNKEEIYFIFEHLKEAWFRYQRARGAV